MHLFAQADAVRLPLESKSVDIVIGSPPYIDARLYLDNGMDLGISRDTDSWIRWMLLVTQEALRVSRNCVIWVVSGVTRGRNYQCGPEGLMEAWRQRKVPSGVWQDGIELPGEAGSMCRPVYWHRVGIPGSGGKDWFRADVEYVLAFKRPGPLPFSDNTACGHPPKFGPGGEMSYRVKDGHRRNQWGRHENCKTSNRRPDGTFQEAHRPSHVFLKKMEGKGHEGGDGREEQGYKPPVLANPGTLLKTTTGGGHLGWAGAHENEAPYPEAVPSFFIKSMTKPGDIVCDPFSGSGTTVSAAVNLGRRGIGFDLRMSQCQLGKRRLERPNAPVAKPGKKPVEAGSFMALWEEHDDLT